MPETKNPPPSGGLGAPTCALCEVSSVAVQLNQCRICHRRFCDDCAYRSRVGLFCSAECARRFLLGDSEEEEEEEELDGEE